MLATYLSPLYLAGRSGRRDFSDVPKSRTDPPAPRPPGGPPSFTAIYLYLTCASKVRPKVF